VDERVFVRAVERIARLEGHGLLEALLGDERAGFLRSEDALAEGPALLEGDELDAAADQRLARIGEPEARAGMIRALRPVDGLDERGLVPREHALDLDAAEDRSAVRESELALRPGQRGFR